MRLVLALAITVHVALAQQNADKPRVFITDSESWEMVGSAAGANGAFASQVQAGARPQTAEIIKTFGERCPDVITNNRIEKADYVVVLDHESGKGYLRHRNKVAVFGRISGDSVVSHSTLSLGNSFDDKREPHLWVASLDRRTPPRRFIHYNGGMQVHSSLLNVVLHDSPERQET